MKTYLLLALAAILSSLASPNLTNSFAQSIQMPERGLCAHRGDQGIAPENTVSAFIGAALAGAQQIELDVQKTKDGKLVIMHDLTVDRTTNGKGAVKDLTLDEIKSFDVVTSSSCVYDNVKVPTFEEALDCLPNNVWINIHVKPGEGIAEEALKLVIAKSRLGQSFFAVNKKEMEALRKLCPEVKICCMERGSNVDQYVQNAINWKCDYIQLCTPYTQEHISALKKANIKINYFGTDDPKIIQQLISDGVDYPLVNTFTIDWPATNVFENFKLNETSQSYRDKAQTLLPAPKMAKRGLCAHRGDQGAAPENTIPAFIAAAKSGAQQVEFDVQLTRDGKLVIMHDLTVDRTTTGKGAVQDLTFDEIRSFDAGIKMGEEFAGIKVPTFEEALDCLPRNIWINIHVKPGVGIAAEATKVVVAKGRVDQAFIGVENKKDLDEARAVYPDIKIGFLTGNLNENIVNNVISWNCQFMQFTGYTPEYIQTLKNAGITLNFFGTDDFDKIKTLLNDGIDFPLVNYFEKDWPATQGIDGLKLNNLDPNYLKYHVGQ